MLEGSGEQLIRSSGILESVNVEESATRRVIDETSRPIANLLELIEIERSLLDGGISYALCRAEFWEALQDGEVEISSGVMDHGWNLNCSMYDSRQP